VSTGGTGKGACFTGGVIFIGDGIIALTSIPVSARFIGVRLIGFVAKRGSSIFLLFPLRAIKKLLENVVAAQLG
jgi:hypothetical protein